VSGVGWGGDGGGGVRGAGGSIKEKLSPEVEVSLNV
jgi:hypothetical protein